MCFPLNHSVSLPVGPKSQPVWVAAFYVFVHEPEGGAYLIINQFIVTRGEAKI